MAKLYALTQIILKDDEVVQHNTVFDATVAQAKQFDALGAARPATEAEIKDAEKAAALKDGTAFLENVETAARPSVDAQAVQGEVDVSMLTVEGDPQGTPTMKTKGR